MNRQCMLIVSLLALTLVGCSKLNHNSLDTTYFPLGQGYVWVYERQNYITFSGRDGGDISYDTISIKVISMVVQDDWLVFNLEDSGFVDVGEKAMICKGKILVFDGEDTVPLIPPAHFEPKADIKGYAAGYFGDTLGFSLCSGDGSLLMAYSTQRLKGVGVIYQEAELRSPPYYEGYFDRLLYFIKGEDTAWKCPDCP
ncbi:hypothetical protein JXM67_09700 [candidate division WOR-3 bacterium]|nr:hypothetical protein [candidate division WOR-3 bacterium]